MENFTICSTHHPVELERPFGPNTIEWACWSADCPAFVGVDPVVAAVASFADSAGLGSAAVPTAALDSWTVPAGAADSAQSFAAIAANCFAEGCFVAAEGFPGCSS